MNKVSTLIHLLALSTCLLATHPANAERIDHNIRWSGKIHQDLLDFSDNYLKGDRPAQYAMAKLQVDVHVGTTEVTSRIRAAAYFPKPSDIESNGNEVIYYNQGNEQVTIHSAGSISPDGSIQIFDPATIQVSESNKYNTFSDTKVAIIAIPGITTGGMSFLDYEITTDKSKLESPWSRIFYPRGTFDYQNYEVRITHTPETELYYQYAGVDLECHTEDAVTLSCASAHIPALKPDNSVFWRDEIDQLVITEQEPSWNAVAEQMLEKFEQARTSSPAIDRLFAELTENHATLEEKISAIHQFVSRDIRYNSMSGTGNTITPHDIRETLHNRYGDCKDKSALLLELLERLGLKPIPVLVATDRKDLRNLGAPSLRYFDHVIVCNDTEDYNFCIDATDTDTDWRYLSSWIQGSASLPLKSDTGPARLPLNKYRWQMKTRTNIAFDSKGGQQEKNTRMYVGEYAGAMRGLLTAKSPEDQQQWAQEQYQDIISSEVEPDFTFSGIDQITPELLIKSEVYYEPFVDPQSDLAYSEYDAWLQDEIRSLKIDNTHYGYQFPGIRVESNFEFDLARNWKLGFPGQMLDLKHEYGSLSRQLVADAGVDLMVTSTLEVPSRYISADEIEAFNDFLDTLRREAIMRFEAEKAE